MVGATALGTASCRAVAPVTASAVASAGQGFGPKSRYATGGQTRTSTRGTGGIRTPGPCGPPAFKAGAFVRSATVPTWTVAARQEILMGSQHLALTKTLTNTAASTLRAARERCRSGRTGRPAKALTAARWSVGSNPTLSAALRNLRHTWVVVAALRPGAADRRSADHRPLRSTVRRRGTSAAAHVVSFP